MVGRAVSGLRPNGREKRTRHVNSACTALAFIERIA